MAITTRQKSEVRLTGSRAFGVSAQYSDWDYVCLHKPPFVRLGSGWRKIPYRAGDGYEVYSNGPIHVIVCCSLNAYRRWMQAHRHCMIERPKSKERRKVIFDHYMHGCPLLNIQRPLTTEQKQWFKRKHEWR